MWNWLPGANIIRDALVGAFSVIVQLHRLIVYRTSICWRVAYLQSSGPVTALSTDRAHNSGQIGSIFVKSFVWGDFINKVTAFMVQIELTAFMQKFRDVKIKISSLCHHDISVQTIAVTFIELYTLSVTLMSSYFEFVAVRNPFSRTVWRIIQFKFY